MPEPTPDAERVRLERDRFEREKSQARATNPLSKHLGAIVVVLAAFVTGAFSLTQVYTTKITKEKELQIVSLQNQAEMDRRWRIEMLGFLERHEERLFSQSQEESSQAITLLELSFPPNYVQPVRSKLRILVTQAAPHSEIRVVKELLEPLVKQFDRTKEAFDRYVPGNLAAEAELRDGNQDALDLLVSKSELIPDSLREDAARLVEHYEQWLQEYSRLRTGQHADWRTPVFTGPSGYPFPAMSARRFRDELEKRKLAEDNG